MYVVMKTNGEIVDGEASQDVEELAQRFAAVALESGKTGLIPGLYRLVPVDLRRHGPRAIQKIHERLQLYNWAVNLEACGKLGSGPIVLRSQLSSPAKITMMQERDHARSNSDLAVVASRREGVRTWQQMQRRVEILASVLIDLGYAVEWDIKVDRAAGGRHAR